MPMIEMELREIQIFQVDQSWQRVLLEEKDGSREFPIYIGEGEALYLEMAVKKQTIARPLTHDFIQNLIGEIDAQVERVEVVDLREETFYGQVVLRTREGEQIGVDARPSDALIIAMKNEAPIFVAEHVLEDVCAEDDDDDEDA